MSALLTEARLVAIMPGLPVARVALWTAALTESMTLFALYTRDRAAAFLAQIAVESNECRALVENLSYSAPRLMAVWPGRFPTAAAAAPFARNPVALANRVYSGRLGNGDAASGDGWRFRGRGLMQITGRVNYRMAGRALGFALETYPEQLEQPLPAALAAAHYFASRGCAALADGQADEAAAFDRICILVNGGRHGLESRRAYWRRAQAVLR